MKIWKKKKPVFIFISWMIFLVIGSFVLTDLILFSLNIPLDGELSFRFIDLLINLTVLLGMVCILLVVWKRLISEDRKIKEPNYKKIFILISSVGIILFIISFFTLPFVIIRYNLDNTPIGFLTDLAIRFSIFLMMIGFAMTTATMSEKLMKNSNKE